MHWKLSIGIVPHQFNLFFFTRKIKGEAPTMILAVDDDTLTGGGKELKNMIWDAARSEIQQWTGEELSPVSLYGIRKYTTGAVLATHVDRLPLVSSAIINVAQDVDEPWPLELIGHDGKAYNGEYFIIVNCLKRNNCLLARY